MPCKDILLTMYGIYYNRIVSKKLDKEKFY